VTFALDSAKEWADYKPWERYGDDVVHRAMLKDHCEHVRQTALHFGGPPGGEKVPADGGRGDPSSSLPSDKDGTEASDEEERTPSPKPAAGKRKAGAGTTSQSSPASRPLSKRQAAAKEKASGAAEEK
jgi:hypothetical protein